MPRPTNKERRLHTTVAVSDKEYAKLAQWATIRGMTWGAGLRALIAMLPDVSAGTVHQWMVYRKRSGHERPLPTIEEIERTVIEARKLDMDEEAEQEAFHAEVARQLAVRSAAAPLAAPEPGQVPSEIDAIFRRTGADKMKEPPASHVATEDQMRELRGEELTDLPLTKAQEEDLKRKRANEKKAKETEL